MNRVAECYERSPRPFPAALLQACLRYPWPGNLRELENFVKRYLVMGDASLAMSELQPKSNGALVPGNWEPKSEEPTMREANANGAAADEGNHRNLKSLVRSLKNETEIHAITRALEETNWNRKHAAQLLNISYRGLLYKIRQHQIAPTFGTHLWPFLRNNGER
jgi:DNA-binding NtrC family response regulator